jgi:hypothetical protein
MSSAKTAPAARNENNAEASISDENNNLNFLNSIFPLLYLNVYRAYKRGGHTARQYRRAGARRRPAAGRNGGQSIIGRLRRHNHVFEISGLSGFV